MTRRELIQKLLSEGKLDDTVLVRVLKKNAIDALESWKVVPIEKVSNFSGHGTCIDISTLELNIAKVYE